MFNLTTGSIMKKVHLSLFLLLLLLSPVEAKADNDYVVESPFDTYVSDVLVCGRKPAYDTKNRRFLCVAPAQNETFRSSAKRY